MQLIKLKFNTQTTEVGHSLLKSKFIEACENLDASIFEPFIDEEIYFQNLDKYRFLDSVKTIFDKCKNKGFSRLEARDSTCGLCHQGCANVEFHVPNGKFMFAYYFNEEKGVINDLYICNVSQSRIEEHGSVVEAAVSKPNYL